MKNELFRMKQKAFALPAVLIILVVLTLVLITRYQRSSSQSTTGRAASTEELLRVQALSEFELLRKAFFASLEQHLPMLPPNTAILNHHEIRNPPSYRAPEGVSYKISCLGQGNENFDAGNCQARMDSASFPKSFDIKLSMRDPGNPGNIVEVSGYLNVEPERLSAFSLWLSGSTSPVVYGNGQVRGNVAISFREGTSDPKIYFMNNDQLRFTGTVRISGADPEEPLVYGRSPNGTPLSSPGPVAMDKGYTFDSDFQNVDLASVLQNIVNTQAYLGNNEWTHTDPNIDRVIKRTTPSGRLVESVALKFGEEGGECKFRFEQKETWFEFNTYPDCTLSCPGEVFYEACIGSELHCVSRLSENIQVWPPSGETARMIPNNSVIVAQSKNIKVQPLDPADHVAETCGSAFTVVGTKAGNINFETSFVDKDLTGSTNDRLKVAFGIIGNPTSTYDTSSSAFLGRETRLKDGTKLEDIYNGTATPPTLGNDANFEINATLIAFTKSIRSCVDFSPPDCWDAPNSAIEIGEGMLTMTPPNGSFNGHFGKLKVVGGELSRDQSRLRRMGEGNGNVVSGFAEVDRTFLPNLAPGLNSEILISLVSTVTHLELRFKSLPELLAEYNLGWEPAPGGGSTGGTIGGGTGGVIEPGVIYTFGNGHEIGPGLDGLDDLGN